MLNVVVTETGPLFTLEEAKEHLRVDDDEQDTLITTYANAAVAKVLQYCNLGLVPDGEVPEVAFKAAALLVLGDFYENREPRIEAGTTVYSLINPYRQLRV